MEKTVSIIDALPKLSRKINVCAYARVSSGKDAMLHSLSAQVSYYNKLIQQNENWLYCGVYSDEAISGTKPNRNGFVEMVADCRAGKIDLIITKSISRFARNTATLLEVVRELKKINVDVYFEEQNIHTMSDEGELILTFLASFAQEEARSMSENMKWRVKKNFEEGLIWGCAPYGYEIQNAKFIVVPEEAEVVRLVYKLYLEGYGSCAIARILSERGCKPKFSNRWCPNVVRSMLRQYAYTGNLLLQTCYNENFMTKKMIKNKGEKPMYHVEDAHEPIISLEDFKTVQLLMSKRCENYQKEVTPTDYAFKRKLFCAVCGKRYSLKKSYKKLVWICKEYSTFGRDFCSNKQVPDEELRRVAMELLEVEELTNEIIENYIEKVIIGEDRHLTFYLTDGSIVERQWVQRSRRESWTPEMRENARIKRKEQERHGKGYSNTANA